MVWNTGCHERFRVAIWSRRWNSRTRAFVYLDLKTAVYRLFGKGEYPSRKVHDGQTLKGNSTQMGESENYI